MKTLLTLSLVLCAGCQTSTTDPVYVQANRARLQVVQPWLNAYATDHPASASNVADVVAAWRIEVQSQSRNAPATQPTK